MSWVLKNKLKTLISQENGVIVKDWGGKTSIALVYPNTYKVGMGNLAIHSLYKMLNGRDTVVCERAFLPNDKDLFEHKRTSTPIMTLESQRPLAEFDIIAFSVSFENDLLGILPILNLSKIPHKAKERNATVPFIIAGGAALTLNPRPVSQIFDAIVLGEAEGFEKDLMPLLATKISKADLLNEIKNIDNIYSPGKNILKLKSRHVKKLDDWPTETFIHTDQSEFGNMHLMEVQRGCPYHCKFCATPMLYAPARNQTMDTIRKMIKNGLPYRKKFGLIGAHILSHPNFLEIAETIHDLGATFSPSSVRAVDIDDRKAALLAKSGHRSIALGIEAGNERLRSTLGKRLSDDQIIEASSILAKHGITKIRLYFMIGLPDESDDDIKSIATLSNGVLANIEKSALKKSRSTAVDITISPFIPKPMTTFEHSHFAKESALKAKIRLVKKLVSKTRGIEIHADAPANAAIEALLSTGSEKTLLFMEEAHRTDNARTALKKFMTS